MPNRKTKFSKGEHYHVYNRGNNKQRIFNDIHDYERFMKLLYIANSKSDFLFSSIPKNINIYSIDRGEPIVSIGSWAIIDNHFHLLIKEKGDNNISKFMHRIATSYSMYYNKKHERTGTIFEGRFKSKHINEDIYLKYIFSYIQLNPVIKHDKNFKISAIKDKNSTFEFLRNYKYSSYQDFWGIKRPENAILNLKDFPEYFPTKKDFEEEIFGWLSYNDDDHDAEDQISRSGLAKARPSKGPT